EVGDALSKRVVVLLVGDRSAAPIIVVEPNEDSESLSRPGSIILSGQVGGVVAQPLGEQNPALLPHLRHIVFAAVVVETKDVGRFSGLGEGGGRKSEERQKRAHV